MIRSLLPLSRPTPRSRGHVLRVPRVPRVLAVLLAVALAGCSSDRPLPDGPVAAEAIEGCAVEAGGNGTIRTVAAWVTFWADNCPSGAPDPPSVDFDRQMVAWYSAGEQPTGGYLVELEEAQRQGDTLHLAVTVVEPGPACAVTLALTYPTGVWILNGTGDVTFTVSSATRDCIPET